MGEGADTRKILLLDLDHFFTQVEERDDPRLRGQPVAVGGKPPRGVIATANYDARRWGVHSALSTSIAYQRCPSLVLMPPRMEHYKDVSRQVMEILQRYSDQVEQVSIDEAYLDVTHPLKGPPSGTLIAKAIKADVLSELGLTISVGVSYNKSIAKLCAGQGKPNALNCVRPGAEALAYLAKTAVEDFQGVGPVTAAKLRGMGIRNGKDLQNTPLEKLEQALGKNGVDLGRVARGIDERPVTPERDRKSVSNETTFTRDLHTVDELMHEVLPLADAVERHLTKIRSRGRGVQLKIKYADHTIITRRQTIALPINSADAMCDVVEALLRERVPLDKPVRLIGVGVFDLQEDGVAGAQDALFPQLVPA